MLVLLFCAARRAEAAVLCPLRVRGDWGRLFLCWNPTSASVTTAVFARFGKEIPEGVKAEGEMEQGDEKCDDGRGVALCVAKGFGRACVLL